MLMEGDYSKADSIRITEAYATAKKAVGHMYDAMNLIWEGSPGVDKNIKVQRQERWMNQEHFTTWLGQPEKIGLAYRRIKKIHSKFNKKVVLLTIKENKGKCRGWISAWAIPFGKVKIRLCEDFFIYRTHLQEKVLIHEMGHEAGILFHRRIHGCRVGKRAASSKKNVAKRSTENYAWLAMSYLGLECFH